ncbi:EspA/EspE family type VII secretion system effector [Mycobacterium sp. SMC-4]|uniref:EspA/EspE family type VII secretion system effector n=1 Tax=Mycobacterium sp. SMC-4 TaxID=2857059 RepID=UPI003D083535
MDLNDLFGRIGKPSPAYVADQFGAGGPRRAYGSPILAAGQAVIAGMRSTTGWGEPESGERFGLSAARFDTAGGTLATALPTSDWEGAGAQTYAAANLRQSGRTTSIGVLDRRVQQVVSRQARQIATHRENLDQQSDFLADLSHATRALSFVPGVGPAAKTTVEVAAVATAVQAGEQDLRALTYEVSDSRAELNQLAVEYASLAVPESPPVLTEEPMLGKDGKDDGVVVDEHVDEHGQHVDDARHDGPYGSSIASADGDPGVGFADPPSPIPASTAPWTSTSAAPAAAAPADPMAAMNAAVGAAGGMIGAIVAPLSAVLAAAVGAATESVSAVTSAGGDTEAAEESALQSESADEARDDADEPDVDDRAATAHDTGAAGPSAGDPAPASPTTEGARTPVPADRLEPAVPPPAATRPPQ